jgi:tRNA-specific 2-thiouridylase
VGLEGFKPFVWRLIPSGVGSIPTHSRQPLTAECGLNELEGVDLRALVLLSGGLDSILAACLLTEQGIDVTGVSFESPFFTAEKARRAAERLGIDFVAVDISEEVLGLIERPKYGFGRNMNPCIDCHALMVSKAAALMDELGASFVATGEVVGQRPKSQMRYGLEAVERESDLKGYLLRPLSAKLLTPTVPEEKGWIDRERLLGLHGRTRKPQMQLAEQFGIEEYESPAGGCLLTDENFARAIRDLKEHEGLTTAGVRLLSIGRQFRLSDSSKLAVGRNHAENERLFQLDPPGGVYLKTLGCKGPVGVITGSPTSDDEVLAAGIVSRYADTGEAGEVTVEARSGEERHTIRVTPMTTREVRRYAVG